MLIEVLGSKNLILVISIYFTEMEIKITCVDNYISFYHHVF